MFISVEGSAGGRPDSGDTSGRGKLQRRKTHQKKKKIDVNTEVSETRGTEKYERRETRGGRRGDVRGESEATADPTGLRADNSETHRDECQRRRGAE